MREQYSSFLPLTEDQISEITEDSTLVLDTNVLLNFYRYQETTRTELFKILNQLKKRLWIPYHVGLEFHRNRVNVISDQIEKKPKIRSIVENGIKAIENSLNASKSNKNHDFIDIDELIKEIKNSANKILESNEKNEETAVPNNLFGQDDIYEKIHKIIGKNIGTSPANQQAIDSIEKEGQSRYEKEIPPGYKDTFKENTSPYFTYGGITYQQKYSDLIVWKQIIDHAKNKKIKNLIIITDDMKEDWWWQQKSLGTKRLGPRPELKEEIIRISEVKLFHMYSTEQFLKHFGELVDNSSTIESAIADVRSVKSRKQNRPSDSISRLHDLRSIHFYNTLSSASTENVTPIKNYIIENYEPEFIENTDESTWTISSQKYDMHLCFKTVFLPMRNYDKNNVLNIVNYYLRDEGNDNPTLLIVADNYDQAEAILNVIKRPDFVANGIADIVVGMISRSKPPNKHNIFVELGSTTVLPF